MSSRRFVTASLLAIMIAVVATIGSIGTGAGAGAPSSGQASCASPVASPAATPSASPVSSPTASPIPECETPTATATAIASVTIEARDLYFAPNTATLAANTTVTLTIKNAGALPHDFYVDGLNIRTAVIPPGTSVTVKINAAPGSYQFYCNQPGHRFAGMTGTLVVK